MTTARGFHTWALLAGIVVAVASTWPVAAHLSTAVIDGGTYSGHPAGSQAAANYRADVLQTVWIVSWNLHALVTQPFHFFDANIFYPAPAALARSDNMLATALLGSPARAVGGPVLAHETALLMTVVLNVWTAGYVVARWSGAILPGVAAGMLFAVSPFHQAWLHELQMLGTAYFPLMLLGMERFAVAGEPRWLAVGAAALLAESLSGQYLACFALVTWTVTATVALGTRWLVERNPRQLVRDAGSLVLSTGGAGVLLVAYALPYLRLAARGELADYTTAASEAWPVWSSLSSPWAVVSGDRFPYALVPRAVWPLTVLGLVSLFRGGVAGRARATMLVTVAIAGALLAAGPRGSGSALYRLAVAVVPGFRTMRDPSRAVLLVHLACALAAGCGVSALGRRLRRSGPVVAASLVCVALVESWHAPLPVLPMPVGSDLPGAYRFLARCGGGDPLLEIPPTTFTENWLTAEPMFFSTFHWLPLLNGRTSYPPSGFREISSLATRLPNPYAVAGLRKLTGVRWLLVHCDRGREAASAVTTLCAEDAQLSRSVRTFGNDRLFDLGPVERLPRDWPVRWTPGLDCEETPVVTDPG